MNHTEHVYTPSRVVPEREVPASVRNLGAGSAGFIVNCWRRRFVDCYPTPFTIGAPNRKLTIRHRIRSWHKFVGQYFLQFGRRLRMLSFHLAL
jgi:hypothetical protein